MPLGSMGGAATAVVSVPSPVRSKQSAGGHAAQSTSSLALKAYFQNLLSELTAAAKQLALSEFNSWLVGCAPRAFSVRSFECLNWIRVHGKTNRRGAMPMIEGRLL